MGWERNVIPAAGNGCAAAHAPVPAGAFHTRRLKDPHRSRRYDMQHFSVTMAKGCLGAGWSLAAIWERRSRAEQYMRFQISWHLYCL